MEDSIKSVLANRNVNLAKVYYNEAKAYSR